MVKAEIVQLLGVSKKHLGVLLQQAMQIGGTSLLRANAKEIRQPHACPNASITWHRRTPQQQRCNAERLLLNLHGPRPDARSDTDP